MNKLDTTTRKLQILLAGTVSTTACDWTVSYRDENRNAPQNLGAVPSATMAGTVSSLTAVDLLSAPSVNTIVRVPERISFKNRDTGTVIPTFRLNDNATTYQYWSPTLLTGESAFYDENQGWYSTDASGARKIASAASVDASTVATQAEMEAATSTAKIVTPGRQQFHPSASKAWVYFTSITTTAILASYNVTSLTDNGAGDTTVNFTTNFSSANFASAFAWRNAVSNVGAFMETNAQAAGSIEVRKFENGNLTDCIQSVVCFGDQ